MRTINFLGDVYLNRPAHARLFMEGEFVCNLEFPITQLSQPVCHKVNLKSEAVYFKETFGRNPVAVCLANNHIMDYGNQGFLETVQNLQAQGIQYFGAGSVADHCHNPLYLHVGGQKLALLGYVCPTVEPVFASNENFGVMPIRLDWIARDIQTAKENMADQIIVQVHWGKEDVGLPKPADVALAHDMIDLGVDLIVGHHAHCIQPYEVYKGRYIFYGLGNTLFLDVGMGSAAEDDRLDANKKIKWHAWNKKSLAVQYDTMTKSAGMQLLVFGKTLEAKPCANPARAFSLKKTSEARYIKKYFRVMRLAMLRRVATSFFSRPRIPKLKNMPWLIALFKMDKTP